LWGSCASQVLFAALFTDPSRFQQQPRDRYRKVDQIVRREPPSPSRYRHQRRLQPGFGFAESPVGPRERSQRFQGHERRRRRSRRSAKGKSRISDFPPAEQRLGDRRELAESVESVDRTVESPERPRQHRGPEEPLLQSGGDPQRAAPRPQRQPDLHPPQGESSLPRDTLFMRNLLRTSSWKRSRWSGRLVA
jgi:hypothetical protein